jgi:hypothetical protein
VFNCFTVSLRLSRIMPIFTSTSRSQPGSSKERIGETSGRNASEPHLYARSCANPGGSQRARVLF